MQDHTLQNQDLPTDQFSRRHIGTSQEAQQKMLAELGYATAEDLAAAAIPKTIYTSAPLQTQPALHETAALEKLKTIAAKNRIYTSLIGSGWHNTHTPAVIRRNMLENPAWYTAYTPYQPEISQGRLEMLLAFQTMVSDLTGCEIANASMLDEASAAAEAMTMLHRLSKTKRNQFFVDNKSHPQTVAVIQTRAEPLHIEIILGDPETDLQPENLFGAFLCHPASTGELRNLTPVIEQCQATQTLTAVSTDLLACCLITPPGELGADVVVGSAQRFGVPLGYGGPHAGFLATTQKNARALPGRLVGSSVDTKGRPAYRLALQTREQHIRREKATSNICTAQALLANVAAAYAAWHGADGLTAIANRIHTLTTKLAVALEKNGFDVTENFFDTITITTKNAEEHYDQALKQKINLRQIDTTKLGITIDETSTHTLIDTLIHIFTGKTNSDDTQENTPLQATNRIPESQQRQSSFLTHPTFTSYQTEHEMLRWLRTLSDKDLALDRTMIPLGSCTMKLNAAAEMEPISWPEFANIHPYAPKEQTAGYQQLISELEETLATITGYASVSLQPNAGSQGEYAGLLAIRAWHKQNGNQQRTICLIPSSAHGTNAASAVLAGMRVVVVRCDDHGNIDLDDLTKKIEEHKENLAALMITYPSTHGVYEQAIPEICNRIHEAGGQVYTDGANLNALVGVAKPGKFGSDVSHLNLHKTFCIPHGGGGPGVGPVGVAEHLVPFLPGHPVIQGNGDPKITVSSAPWGSAGILPISWMYINMMGPDGLQQATESAVLAANYLAKCLGEQYPILYTGTNNLIAHECILDIRPITASTGVTVTDIAKRLTDYGFHAPTISFPVPGTLMIEPTESESLNELNRFCEAMLTIHNEISEISRGDISLEESVLRNAPHTAEDLLCDVWEKKYSRSKAAYPTEKLRQNRYFPPVSRIDDAYGDRNLNCSCLPMESYQKD